MRNLLGHSKAFSDTTVPRISKSGYANPGSSESDLVSGKMKEAVICTIVLYYKYDNNI